MAPRGISELKRHFQRKHQLRLDHRNREQYFPRDFRGRDARVLHGDKLETENESHKDYEVPKNSSERPRQNEVVDGKPFTFTTERDRVGIQFQLWLTLLRSGDSLWGLENNWTLVAVPTGPSAAVADFSWNPQRIGVSYVLLYINQ